MTRVGIRAVVGGVCASLAVLAGVLVMVASADSEAAPAPPVVNAPHGAEPTIYAGPGQRAQLNGLWRFRRDRDDTGLDKGFQTGKFGGELVRVPYVPDATKITGRRGIPIFRGTVAWYRTNLTVPVDGNYALRFESINHRARVFLDGKEVARHKGEYLPFDVRAFLKGGERHKLVVRADYRGPTAMKRDGWHRLWFNFGGINRGVSIRRIAASELAYPMMQTKLVGGQALVDLRAHVHNNGPSRPLGARGTLTRGDRKIAFEFPAEAIAKEGTEVLETSVKIDDPALWSPSAPNLWELALEVPGETTYRARVGLRDMRARGADLILNGTAIKLRGASIHEDVFGRGDGLRPIDQDRMVAQLKAIDANATRSQHPLDQGLLERFDAAGIMVWQGVGPTDAPGAWTSRGEKRVRVAKNRVRTTFRQAQLHPSIITWNLANEVAGNGHPEGQIPYVNSMAAELKRVDPGRPIALDIWGAHPPQKTSTIYENVDMIGWTNYIGWYEATHAPAEELRDLIRARLRRLRNVFPDKVIAVTEFGAEGNGRNATTQPGGYAFQAHLLDLHLSTYARIPNLAGALVWNLRDFGVNPSFYGGSIRREVPNIKLVRGLNQKGLFDVRNKAKPSVEAVGGRFRTQAAAAGG